MASNKMIGSGTPSIHNKIPRPMVSASLGLRALAAFDGNYGREEGERLSPAGPIPRKCDLTPGTNIPIASLLQAMSASNAACTGSRNTNSQYGTPNASACNSM